MLVTACFMVFTWQRVIFGSLVVPPARVRWENAGTLLTDMRQSTNQAPLLLDSHDESGTHVQIFVG